MGVERDWPAWRHTLQHFGIRPLPEGVRRPTMAEQPAVPVTGCRHFQVATSDQRKRRRQVEVG